MNANGSKSDATEDGAISLPESFGLLKIEEAIDLATIVKHQLGGLESTLKEGSVGFKKPGQVIAFVVPLPAYMPLPDPYHATMMDTASSDSKLSEMTMRSGVSITGYDLEMKVGKQAVPVKLSVAVACLPLSETYKDVEHVKDLHRHYLDALHATNNVIDAYKMTPWRHSHVLHNLTGLGTPGNIYVALFDTEAVKIVDAQTVMQHQHLLVDGWGSRVMTKIELSNFAAIHTSMHNGTSMPLWLASKVNEAIDARCLGRDDDAIILADHYAELVIRYLLFGTLRTKGMSLKDARARSQKRVSIDLIVEDLAKELGISPGNFKSNVGYSKWVQNCRKPRNKLSHEVQKPFINAAQSFSALDSTLVMIHKMCDVVNQKFPGAMSETQWLMAMSQFTEAVKAARKSKKTHRRTDGQNPFHPDIDLDQLGMRPSA